MNAGEKDSKMYLEYIVQAKCVVTNSTVRVHEGG
jgi:hypothetical protein